MDFILQNFFELIEKTWQQIYLAGIATIIAILIGVPVGILVARKDHMKQIVLGFASVLQTVPSLALLVFLLPFLGIGIKPALVALSVYAFLPIIRNTVTGLLSIDLAMLEAADGLGFTRQQRLWLVELPLALPVIIAGIRTASVMSVGIATLATFIGAGGLGDFIYLGLSVDDNRLILLGAIPAAFLALFLDFLIARVERIILRGHNPVRRIIKGLVYFFVFALIIFFAWLFSAWVQVKEYSGSVVIGTKNFTEQIILGNLMADMISANTHLKVIKKFNLGGTLFCHKALVSGEIDIYPEYTGTAYLDILRMKNPQSPQQIYQTVKDTYKRKFNVIWLHPFGFNNTEALGVSQSFYKKYNVTKISDLVPIAPRLNFATPGDCLRRLDCYPNLKKSYHLKFGKVTLMEPSLLYRALYRGNVDVAIIFTTDGRIFAYHLVVLNDDKHVFPTYYAAPIIRGKILKQYPQIKRALKPLLGLLNNKVMQQLNYLVDVKRKTPATVAKDFLIAKGLLK